MPKSKKNRTKPKPTQSSVAANAAFPNVSALWLVKAAAVALVAALLLAWLTLCLLYWQGSWQLLYHPAAEIKRTPAALGLAYQPVQFAVNETGAPRLSGWWVPVDMPRYTVLYLHGADGNLGAAVDAIGELTREKLAVFAVDYRGYGASQSPPNAPRPSEKQFRQDAEWALTWLTLTRNIPAKNIVVYGSGLGADLAAELAADHGELAGVILDEPGLDAMAPVFNDARSKLVPAHWLVADRFDIKAAAARLSVPSLWLLPVDHAADSAAWNGIFAGIAAPHEAVWVASPATAAPGFEEHLNRWLDDLPARH